MRRMRKKLRLFSLLRRLRRDEEGSYLVFMTLLMPLLIGVVGLGTEGGWWLYYHQTLQNAADSAALSGATALSKGETTAQIQTQAYSVASTYCASPGASNTCFVNGQNGVTVAVNVFPVATPPAVQVTVTQQLTPQLASLVLSNPVSISATAKAIINYNTADCILALKTTGTNISVSGNNDTLNLTNCSIFSNSTDSKAISVSGNSKTEVTASSIGTVGGQDCQGHCSTTPTTGNQSILDPYASDASSLWNATCQGGSCANQTVPTGCSSCQLNPGVFPSGMTLAQNVSYTMAPGVYYLQGDLSLPGNGTTLTGNGVTLVISGNHSIQVTKNNPTIDITAPTTGWNAGIAIWEPTSTATNTLGKNNLTMNLNGVIYAPKADWSFDWNNQTSVSCAQFVVGSMSFGKNNINSTMYGPNDPHCNNPNGVKKFGARPALVL
jgi:Flp pilus assembly protein TadG